MIRDKFKFYILSYQATVDSLSFKTVLLNGIIYPAFYLAFFYFVRNPNNSGINQENIILTLLIFVPLTSCIFYVATSFSLWKQWNVFDVVLRSPTSFHNISLHISIVNSIINLLIILLYLVFFITIFEFNLSMYKLIFYIFIVCLSTFTLSSFGVMCSIFILPLKDRMIVTNSLFYLVLLSSGFYFTSDSNYFSYLQYLNPVYPYVKSLNVIYNEGNPIYYLLFGMFNCFLYQTLSYLSLGSIVLKLRKTNNYQ